MLESENGKLNKLSTRLRLPESTVKYHLVDLEALDIVEKTNDEYQLKNKSKVKLIF